MDPEVMTSSQFLMERLKRVTLLLATAVCWSGVAAAQAGTGPQPPSRSISDYCFAARGWPESGRIGAAFERKVRDIFRDDRWKVEALLYAFPQACRSDLISLVPSAEYSQLLQSLQRARKEYETTGVLSSATMVAFGDQGVTRREIPNPRGGQQEWQLVISDQALSKLKIRHAADLTSNGLMFIEAYYQLSSYPEFAGELRIFLEAIEKSAREIIEHSDENHNGIIGWGRLWVKGRDGAILHSSVPLHNMYFGGYTYFPRMDAFGNPTCERSPALQEETFDHGYNDLFLLETYLLTHERRLAEDIISLVGRSFDDTYEDGGTAGPGKSGWYYWKQLGKKTGTALPKCVEGRQIKNTNLNMGVALRLYAEILRRNSEEGVVKAMGGGQRKYGVRGEKVVSTNDWEIFANNNFGYQGMESRSVEAAQEPSSPRLLYDRTQQEMNLDASFLGELRGIILAGNRVDNRVTPEKVILCSGDTATPSRDVSTGSSCWNHLAFEAQDYFRLMRYEDLWMAAGSGRGRAYLDAMTRNLAAAKVVLDGRRDRYARSFPDERGAPSVNETIEIAQYGYFCMARKISSQPAVRTLPKAHQKFLESVSAICDDAPPESVSPAVFWRRGHTFYELYLSADRLRVPAEAWLLSYKRSTKQ